MIATRKINLIVENIEAGRAVFVNAGGRRVKITKSSAAYRRLGRDMFFADKSDKVANLRFGKTSAPIYDAAVAA